MSDDSMPVIEIIRKMKTLSTIALGLLLVSCGNVNNKAPEEVVHHYTDIRSFDDLKEFFAYRGDSTVIISGHRGGMENGYPENCIESFERTLTLMPSFFEIDPRLTKDSVIVLMHDKTLDRTTTGKGNVGDYTYEELQALNLVDRRGNITTCRIPTLDECIIWSQGKTVLNLDIKDVPLEVMTRFITERKPENVIYTVWNPGQMLDYCSMDPKASFSIWCRSPKDYDGYVAAGIPWEKVMLAYVGGTMKPEHHEMYEALHAKGIRCMISTAPTHDRCYNDSCKVVGYMHELDTSMRPDIIETDYPFLFVDLK